MISLNHPCARSNRGRPPSRLKLEAVAQAGGTGFWKARACNSACATASIYRNLVKRSLKAVNAWLPARAARHQPGTAARHLAAGQHRPGITSAAGRPSPTADRARLPEPSSRATTTPGHHHAGGARPGVRGEAARPPISYGVSEILEKF